MSRGFAFEEFYSDFANRPGGVRTFPLLAFAGAALYLIEPHYALACIAGLIVVGGAVLIAYVLGPVCLTQPPWFSVGVTVASILLITSRKPLHALVGRVPPAEIWTLGQFLLLVGVVLPLLYKAPAIPFTHITPFNVWLAVVAVSRLSYGSYLLRRRPSCTCESLSCAHSSTVPWRDAWFCRLCRLRYWLLPPHIC